MSTRTLLIKFHTSTQLLLYLENSTDFVLVISFSGTDPPHLKGLFVKICGETTGLHYWASCGLAPLATAEVRAQNC